MADFGLAIKKTLEFEGGYSNDPHDPGGETKFGISKRSYPDEDIAALTLRRAKAIYERDYWAPLRLGEFEHQAVAEAVFDFAVNLGPRRAVQAFQRVLGVRADAVIGPKTLGAEAVADEDLVLARLAVERIARYVRIAETRKSQRKFVVGWVRRALAFAGAKV